jgi:hypothetical protein
LDVLAIQPDLVASRIHLGPELGYDLTVDSYPPLPDQVLRPAARRHASMGQDFLQTFL